MDRKVVPIETKVTRYVPWNSLTRPKSQYAVATMVNYQDQWVGHMSNLQGNNFPGTSDPSPPVSKEGRCDEQDISDRMSHLRLRGNNDFPKQPHPAPSKKVQEPLYSEHDSAGTTTLRPSSTTTTNTTSKSVNTPPHPHPPPNSRLSHANGPLPAPTLFSIPQTFSAYPEMDLFEESLKCHGTYHSLRDLAQEIADKIPEPGSSAVRLQHPTHLLQRRWNERSRKHQKLSFSKTVLVYEYDQGYKDMPMRPESTRFHDEDDDDDGRDSMRKGPWPRNRFMRRWNRLDGEYYWQAYGKEATKKKYRYDDVKKNYVCTTVEEAKDLSGREERMREKAMAKRQERLREEERGDLEEA